MRDEFTVVNYLCLLSLEMNVHRYFDFLYYSPLSVCPFNISYSCNNGPSVSQSSHPLLSVVHRLHPECLGPVPVFTESVGFDWPARIRRPFKGEDEKKPKMCTCSSKAER